MPKKLALALTVALAACTSDATPKAPPIDLSAPVGGTNAVDRRILHGLALSSPEHDVSAVGREARTLQLFDGDCTGGILAEVARTAGPDLVASGFTLMICFDGANIFARHKL